MTSPTESDDSDLGIMETGQDMGGTAATEWWAECYPQWKANHGAAQDE